MIGASHGWFGVVCSRMPKVETRTSCIPLTGDLADRLQEPFDGAPTGPSTHVAARRVTPALVDDSQGPLPIQVASGGCRSSSGWEFDHSELFEHREVDF